MTSDAIMKKPISQISADLRDNMQNISLYCVNKTSKTRQYRAATSPFSGDPAVHLFSVSDPFRSCLTRTNLNKIWLPQFFLRIFSSWQVGGRRRKLRSEKISDAPRVWLTQIAWHWPIYPPSITLNRKHWEVMELYYVSFWACIQKLKWQFVISMESLGLANMTLRGVCGKACSLVFQNNTWSRTLLLK